VRSGLHGTIGTPWLTVRCRHPSGDVDSHAVASTPDRLRDTVVLRSPSANWHVRCVGTTAPGVLPLAIVISSFRDRDTERFFHREPVRRWGPDVLKAGLRELRVLDAAITTMDLQAAPGNRLEKLSGGSVSGGKLGMRATWSWSTTTRSQQRAASVCPPCIPARSSSGNFGSSEKFLSDCAPVNDPFSWPNRSLSVGAHQET
jgi:proteic killer suppression protein